MVELSAAKLDTERMDWLLTMEGQMWLYDRVGRGLTVTRAWIDGARAREGAKGE